MSGMAARKIWQPAASSRLAWATLPGMSVEGTLSMDCTVTGAPPPRGTGPTITCLEVRISRFLLCIFENDLTL